MKSLKISNNWKYYLMFFIFSFISVIFIEYCYYYLNFENTLNWVTNHVYLLFISVFVIMIFMVFIFALFRNEWLAIYIPTLACICYGVGLYFKLLYRKAPALPYEIAMILDLKEMLAFLNEKQRIGVYIVATVSITLLIIILKFVKRKELTKGFRLTNLVVSSFLIILIINYNSKNDMLFIFLNVLLIAYILYALYKWNNKIIYKGILAVLTFAILIPSYNTNLVKDLVSRKAMFPDGDFAFKNYRLDGVIPAFLSYSNLDYIEKPANYSEAEVAKIVEKYKAIEATENANKTDLKEVKPNIVYIMSESLSDPKNVEKVSLNKNPLTNLDKLMEEYSGGTTVAQGFGGGTNMSEFEALTGVSSIFLNNAMFFNNIAKRTEFPSIVSLLENEGYQSAAVHFNSALFYNRSVGYENLGIDHFYNDSELEMEYFDNNKSYSNDESSFNEILKLLDEYDNPTFIHNVTIQNHGPYPFTISNNDYKVDGLYNSEKKVEAETYFKEVEHSDEELQKFIDKLSEFEEPTIVVFWGDHLPYFYEDQDFGSEILDKYRTPILIYSNFSPENNQDLGEISMNYIPTSLFDLYNLKEPAYYYLVKDLKNQSSVLQGQYNKSVPTNPYALYERGQAVEPEVKQIFKDYEMILYDIFVGENYSVDMNFFNIEN